MITQQTATDIAVLYRDIEAAEKLLEEIKAAIDRMQQVDIRDVFGRRHYRLQLGIPNGESGHRILQVPYELAVPVIEATIASHRASLKALETKARAELAGESAQAPAETEVKAHG